MNNNEVCHPTAVGVAVTTTVVTTATITQPNTQMNDEEVQKKLPN